MLHEGDELEDMERSLRLIHMRLITAHSDRGSESFAFPVDDDVENLVPLTPGIISIVGADGSVLWPQA